MKKRSHADDLQGAARLALEATKGVTSLVETMHRTIASGPKLLGSPLEGPARLATGIIYGSVRGIAGMVGASIDLALGQLGELLGESAPGPEREAILAVVNGVLGDHLEATKNPLAIQMRFRKNGAPLALEKKPGRKLLIMVHGSCMNDLMWKRNGRDHGARLEEELGFTTVYLHYNSGLHISANGALLAEKIEQLILQIGEPASIAIVAHSMGGLVARAACYSAEEKKYQWRSMLKKLVCLGTPHQGAPLERGGNWIEFLLGVSRYSAPFRKLARIRSAGVTDLRFGNVLEEDWKDRDRFARTADLRHGLKLPAGVDCYVAAATTVHDKNLTVDKMPGDGLVPVASALGEHKNPKFSLEVPKNNRWIGFGMNHLDLLDREEIYTVLKKWLAL